MDDFDEELYIQARIEEAKEDARDEGRAEGRAEGRVEESKRTEARYAQLYPLLEKTNRTNEFFKATTNQEFRNKLFLEFGIA